MRATKPGERLVQVTRFPRVFPVNVYLVREDDGFTLVDAAVAGSEKGVLAAAREHGGGIRRIALTHAYGDRVGSLDALDPEERRGRLRGSWKTCETHPTCELSPGDRVGSLEVVAAPGHTPGRLAFLDVRDGTLIAGDAFQTRAGIAVSGVPRPLCPFLAIATWHPPTALQSARALRALVPSRLAVGHGPVLEDPLREMDRAIEVAGRGVRERLVP